MSDKPRYPRITVLFEHLWVPKEEDERPYPNFWHIAKAYRKTNKWAKKLAKQKEQELDKTLYVTFFVPNEELDNPETWEKMKTLLEASRIDWEQRHGSLEG